jgi:hypothetical protein
MKKVLTTIPSLYSSNFDKPDVLFPSSMALIPRTEASPHLVATIQEDNNKEHICLSIRMDPRSISVVGFVW